MTRPLKSKAIERLQRALDKISELRQLRRDSQDFQKWRRDTKVAISHTFGNNTSHAKEFTQVSYIPNVTGWGPDRNRQLQVAHVQGLDHAASVIESMIDEIEEYWGDDDQSVAAASAKASSQETTNEVFVVHGRDDGAKDAVARFLEKLGLQPMILHEQPNKGRTIIEKFEQYAQVGFAVVLLTPDDKCSSRAEEGKNSFRARQNVIFELGYFIGRLGRSRTCALFKGDIEIPSDYDGVLYVKMDENGAWQMKLVSELKEAGFQVDANLMHQ